MPTQHRGSLGVLCCCVVFAVLLFVWHVPSSGQAPAQADTASATESYPGLRIVDPRASGMRCFWKVRAWDKDGNVSAWSSPGT